MRNHDCYCKWAYLGLGKSGPHRQIIEDERKAHGEHIAEIQAEQEQKNAEMHRVANSHIPPLRVAATAAVAGLPVSPEVSVAPLPAALLGDRYSE